jgi:AcrR family transcriptional regulator
MADKTSRVRAPRRRPARTPLTREIIAQAALELIDSEGLEALSMRRLGAALDVEAMALYHHFQNKGQLLDTVMERLLDEAPLPPRESMPPLDRLRRFLESYRQIAVRHPHAFILLAYRRFNTERTFQLYEEILGALEDAGFDPPLAARFFRLMGYYTGGAGLADIASRAQAPDATPVTLERLAGSREYPRVAAVAPHLRVANLDAIFDFGLDVIFQAIKKAAPAKRRQR